MSEAPATPKLAASLILLAQDAEERLVTLLLTRTSRASFMPNALVFPGGGLEERDLIGAREALDGGERFEAWSAWGFESELFALAQRRCALRECDEEAGPLLTPALRDLRLPCVGRWLTPTRLPKRFDTSFWLGVLDVPVEVTPDQAEVVEGAWHAPAEVLDAYQRAELELAPPTIRILADLKALAEEPRLRSIWETPTPDRLKALGALLSGAPHPTPICPNLVKRVIENELWLCFPGDEAFHDPSRRYHPQPSSPYHRLSRPMDQPTTPWRLQVSSRRNDPSPLRD